MESGNQVVSFKPSCWFNDVLQCLDFTKAIHGNAHIWLMELEDHI